MTRYEVTLNGISLESLHPSIYIIDVNYEPPQYSIETYSIVKRQGARISRKYKEKAAVSIRFVVRAYDIVERQSIIQSIIQWAKNGGDLRINDRPGQKLICVCDQLPGVESVRGWTEELTIAFAAYAIPYWQSVNETLVSLHIDGSSEFVYNDDSTYTSVDFNLPGTAPYTYLGVKWFIHDVYNARFEIENTSRDEGMFIEDGGFMESGGFPSSPSYEYKTIEYDDEAIPRIYQHSRPAIGSWNDRDLSYYVRGVDEILVTCGATNSLRMKHGMFYREEHTEEHEIDTTQWKAYEVDIELRARGLWE